MQLKAIKETKNLTFYVPDTSYEMELTFVEGGITAGFPSPADDFKEVRISLDKTLVKNGDATFYARVRGQSMINAGIDDGDLLIVDKSLEPQNNKIAVCFLDGEFTVKRLKVEKNVIFLMPENADYKPIKVTQDNELVIWGVVTYVIKRV